MKKIKMPFEKTWWVPLAGADKLVWWKNSDMRTCYVYILGQDMVWDKALKEKLAQKNSHIRLRIV